MRGVFLWFCLPLVLAVGVLLAVLAATIGVTVQSNFWEVEGYRRKLALASGDERKFVIVAGSGAYFGLSAETIEKATGIRSVNLGMQAGLSFDFIASLVRPVLRRGDVVLLPLEYTYYGPVHARVLQRTNTLLSSVAWSLQPQFLLSLPLSDWLVFVRHLSYGRLWEGLESRWRPPRDGVSYPVSAIDRWGDNTADIRIAATRDVLASNIADELARGLPSVVPGGPRLQALDSFLRWCSENGIVVLAAYPNTLAVPPFEGEAFARLRQDVRRYWQRRGISFVDSEDSATIPAGEAMDTPYHPTPAAAVQRTEALLVNLCSKTMFCNIQKKQRK
jgi:hypothetical protein